MTLEKLGRKFAWGLVALLGLIVLNLRGTLPGSRFESCFEALVAALMAGNWAEHMEKRKAAKEARDADAPVA